MPEEIPEKVTNRWLAKLFTTEFFIAAFFTAWAAGGIWASIQNSIAQAQSTADAVANKAEVVQEAVVSIKSDVEVIKTKLQNAETLQKEQAEELAEQRRDIKQILSLVGNGNRRPD